MSQVTPWVNGLIITHSERKDKTWLQVTRAFWYLDAIHMSSSSVSVTMLDVEEWVLLVTKAQITCETPPTFTASI